MSGTNNPLFNWLEKYPLTEAGFKDCVIAMREAGLKATSCNNRIRVFNAYAKWAKLGFTIGRLKEPTETLPTFTADQIHKIAGSKPVGRAQKRLHALICTLFDTGLRIEETLGLRPQDVDFDNLLLTVVGKGSKDRRVPFSFELRKVLWKHQQKEPGRFIFGTLDGRAKLGRRVVLRDFKLLCRRLGFEPPRRTLHATRHTFATNYIRKGGSQFHLMKVLGHTSLEMTKKYVNLQIDDLREVHNALTPLCR